jgi:hypothetical protein
MSIKDLNVETNSQPTSLLTTDLYLKDLAGMYFAYQSGILNISQ